MAINIDGKSYIGNNIVIKNNEVWIDGVKQDTSNQKEINIVVNGNIESLDVLSCVNKISIIGDVAKVKTSTGDVSIEGNVSGDVSTSTGDVKVDGHIYGNVKTTTGDIKYKKDKQNASK